MSLPDKLNDPSEGAAVMFSGGMDSTVTVAHLLSKGLKVFPVAFDDGTTNFQMRRKVAIELTLQKMGILNRLILSRFPDPEPLRVSRDRFGFVPGYKMMMIIQALSYCQVLNVNKLYMGYNVENQDGVFKDEGKQFMDDLVGMFNTIYSQETNNEFAPGPNIEVINPFYNDSKADMVRFGIKLGVDFSTTISCRQTQVGGGLIHCGKCTPCRHRRNSFECSKVDDPTLWASS